MPWFLPRFFWRHCLFNGLMTRKCDAVLYQMCSPNMYHYVSLSTMLYLSISISISVSISIYLYLYIYISISISIYAYMQLCVYIYYTYIHMYTHFIDVPFARHFIFLWVGFEPQGHYQLDIDIILGFGHCGIIFHCELCQ